MGKKQHQKDKLYLTSSEWRDFYGGNKRKLSADNATSGTYVRLPFFCCSITFQPIENPCCTTDGAICEKQNILNFIAKYGRHPITGSKLASTDLIDLHFHKNNEAIRTSGNVYSWDAVEVLNFKCENFVDLLSEVPFNGKSDVIKLQDPVNIERLDISKFYHVRYSMKTSDEDPSKPEYYLNNLNSDAVNTLKKIKQESNSSQIDHALSRSIAKSQMKKPEVQPNRIQAGSISTGALAASFTSTAMDRVLHIVPETHSIKSLVWSRLKSSKSKAYVSINTNMGKLNIELFASDTPKTVHNFLLLCRKNYYDNCKFFRSIRHFIVQTGDPTNTGYGGVSAWDDEPKFEDEFTTSKLLKHDRRGVLSMANSGPNTNGSQFFLTYRPCNQLNKKHTVFGQLVGGFETLSKVESISVDEKDCPTIDVNILSVEIYEDPAQKIEIQIEEELKEHSGRNQKLTAEKLKPNANKTVGKYVNNVSQSTINDSTIIKSEYELKKQAKMQELSRKCMNFSQWE
ncbi:hypothetical protein GJ496_001092 [Pomphorhynchus laevis]|nr:hypothetical protein GJ496_001092 [Pomphorhynchus laevis]